MNAPCTSSTRTRIWQDGGKHKQQTEAHPGSFLFPVPQPPGVPQPQGTASCEPNKTRKSPGWCTIVVISLTPAIEKTCMYLMAKERKAQPYSPALLHIHVRFTVSLPPPSPPLVDHNPSAARESRLALNRCLGTLRVDGVSVSVRKTDEKRTLRQANLKKTTRKGKNHRPTTKCSRF